MTYRYTAVDTVAIEEKSGKVEAASDKSASPSPPTTALPEMTVTAQGWTQNRYSVPNTAVATKLDTPIMQTPVSIQVVPQQVLVDQQAFRLEDALKNVSGVQREHGGGSGFLDSFVIRGFENRFARFRNGLRLGATGSFGYTQELANVEQIEVLKGPASVLYGRIEPGGLINITTKKPLATRRYVFEQQFGSYDHYRTTMDATGALNDAGNLLYRLNFAYLDRGSYRDFLSNDRVFVAPTITWRPSDRTELNLSYEYRNETNQFDSGVPAVGNRPANVPISRRYDKQPGLNGGNEVHVLDFNLTHRFNSQWTLRSGLLGSFANFDQALIIPVNIRDDNRTIERGMFSDRLDGSSISQEDLSAYLDVVGHFELFHTKHAVLAGVDHFEGSSKASELTFGFSPLAETIDLYTADQGLLNHDQLLRSNPLDGFFINRQSWYGVYLQDQITVFNKLHILLGGRHDWAEAANGSSSTSLNEVSLARSDTQRFSPRAGVAYELSPGFSLYGNFVESLGANNGRSSTGQSLKAEMAQQYEVGSKLAMFDGRLTSTLAFFNLTKQNVLTPDLNTFDPGDSIAIGEVRSRGIEVDVAGAITDRLHLISTYAYTDTRLTRDNGGNQGHRMPNVPEHSGSLWLKFEPIPQTFEFGAGTYIAGERQGDVANSFQLPGYARIDAFAAYHARLGRSRLTARVNVNNILDKTYYLGGEPSFSFPRVNIIPADPLTVLASLRLEF
jgi:iron complex outermembrane receptor protein